MTEDETIASPCIRNCCLDDNDICLGCFRSLAEVTGWADADNTMRKAILQNSQLRRADYQVKYPDGLA